MLRINTLSCNGDLLDVKNININTTQCCTIARANYIVQFSPFCNAVILIDYEGYEIFSVCV